MLIFRISSFENAFTNICAPSNLRQTYALNREARAYFLSFVVEFELSTRATAGSEDVRADT